MLTRGSENKKVLFFSRPCLAIAIWVLIGCATSSTTQQPTEEATSPSIEAITISSSGDEMTVVEITNTRSVPYTTFKLIDPLRVVLDISGVPGSELPLLTPVNDGNVIGIHLEQGKADDKTTRVVVGLARDLDYEVAERDNSIRLMLSPKSDPGESSKQSGTSMAIEPKQTGDAGESEQKTTEPRIFFEPRATALNQILGIDFTMLQHGKSRLTVTTDKKASYNLERKTPKTLLLTLEETIIPPLLLRRLDSTHFEGAVDRVTSGYSSTDKRLSLAISLRDIVPFHVDQSDSGICIDFGPTPVKHPEKKIVPVKLVELETVSSADTGVKREATKASKREPTMIPGLGTGKYTGAPMTMDFVNADVTNILRLIGEVSNLNIIWGPDVKGMVSMRLKNVPWDQSLDLLLANNDLGMRRQGNVIWVTTKAKIQKIEEEERKRIQEAQQRLEAERERRLAEQEQAKKLEPLITEYFPVDFSEVGEIKEHIFLSERGSVRVDKRTNTIIMKDIASNIEEARKIIKRFDMPVKQVMIEARIVDASTNFIRDLGIQWTQDTSYQHRTDTSVGFLDQDLTGDVALTAGNSLYGGAFSTNTPEGWAPNIDLLVGSLTGNALGFLSLDARLALAETEGQTKVISAPKVIASNGQQATISRGDVIIIPATENVESTTLDATLSLTVTPTVSYNDYITLAVDVTDDQAPTTSRVLKKAVTTTLIVKSGDTVVIGGIYKEEKSESEGGIPYLRNIPFLGWLFKAQKKSSEKSELLIFLTPTVLSFPTKKM
ncbi:MAG: type IV pilus secretin PilQ [Pseudomonadota bacterium]